MMKYSETDGTSRIMNEKATPFGGWLISAFVRELSKGGTIDNFKGFVSLSLYRKFSLETMLVINREMVNADEEKV